MMNPLCILPMMVSTVSQNSLCITRCDINDSPGRYDNMDCSRATALRQDGVYKENLYYVYRTTQTYKTKFLISKLEDMVNLRSGKKVPFLGKNIPKRPYAYKTPIKKEQESELVSKIASISIHEKDVLPEMPETDADNNVTYGSMPSLEGSVLEENSSNSDVTETNIQSNFQSDPEVQSDLENESEIEINANELPSNILEIVEKFEAKMTKLDKQFELMGLLKASANLATKSSPAFLDSSSSSDSFSSDSSQNITDDSFSTSDGNTINECLEQSQQNVFSDISSSSSLSSTLKTMIDRAVDSDSSATEDDCTDTSESDIAEICEMYNEFCQ